jgi:cytochrome c-type biogenesis protein CcmH
MRRRDFITRLAAGGVALGLAETLRAQQATPSAQGANSNLGPMDQEAAKTVRRPAKRDARPSMTDDERDALERQIRCQCGCTLDVYICRTTDFSCQVSPAMHRDIISLVEGGYSGQEIVDAFVDTYGERALMAPKREGFNLAAYWLPFAALAAGAVGLVAFLRSAQRKPEAVAVSSVPRPRASDATDDELARLRDAIRRDD